jgi:hypothetical protein
VGLVGVDLEGCRSRRPGGTGWSRRQRHEEGGDHFLRDRGSPFCTVVWHEIYAAMLFASVTIQLYLPVMAAAQLG